MGKRYCGEMGAKRRAKTKKMRKDLSYLSNGLAELLGESF